MSYYFSWGAPIPEAGRPITQLQTQAVVRVVVLVEAILPDPNLAPRHRAQVQSYLEGGLRARLNVLSVV